VTDFIALVNELDTTTSSNEKIGRIAAYLRDADPRDGAWAAYLLTEQRKKRTVPSGTLRQIFTEATSLPEWLFAECYAHVGDTAETVTLLITAGYLDRASAVGETDAAPAAGTLATCPLHVWMEEVIPALRSMERGERDARVREWWLTVPPEQLFVLNKLLTGGFRLGVSKITVIKAIAQTAGVPQAVVTHQVTGGFTPSADFLERLRGAAAASPSQPYPFYLASPLPDELYGDGPLSAWRIEWKWDGIRAQIIRREGEVWIWSRGEELVTSQFPDVAEAAEALPDGTVLDAELVAWDREAAQPRPFHQLQRRLGRKQVSKKMQSTVPAATIVFDCLEEAGEDVRGRPLEERLAARDRALAIAWEALGEGSADTEWTGAASPDTGSAGEGAASHGAASPDTGSAAQGAASPDTGSAGEGAASHGTGSAGHGAASPDTGSAGEGAESPDTGSAAQGAAETSGGLPPVERLRTSDPVSVGSWEELEELRRHSREHHAEGFMLKRWGSPYGQGRRRGDWWKFKRDPMSLDAVLIYAQAGSGKRANLFTDYTFALRDGDGLVPFAKAYSGLSNEEIAELDRWIRRNTTERFGPVRQVDPVRVFEIAFEAIVPSNRHKSGVATRFPRILRERTDKGPDEINTVADAKELIP
jgi:DNA ligase-1